MITWHPIAELPEELKDGREVLLWDGEAASVCRWRVIMEEWGISDGNGIFASDGQDCLDFLPTHFAEINAP